MTKKELQIENSNLSAEVKRLRGVAAGAEARYEQELAKVKELKQKYITLSCAMREVSEANMALATVLERSL